MKGNKDSYIAMAIVVAALIIAFQPTEPATLSVNGKGEVTAIPDSAEFSFYIDALRPSAMEAQSVINTKQNAIMAGLEEAGIPKQYIQTQSYLIHKEQRWHNGSYVDLGWRARSSFSIKDYSIDNLGDGT